MRWLGLIPARGGSKGVPGKNIRPLAGRPLLAWTVEAALAAGVLDRVVVSTDDDAIAEVARRCGAEVPFRRPADLAADDTPTLPVLQHAVETLARQDGWRPDAVMTLQPTSPLRQARHIRAAAALFAADPRADSLVSCVPVPHVFHPRSVMHQDEEGYLVPYLDGPLPTRRQDKEPVFARNGAAIYITRTACLDRFIFGGRLLCFVMDEESSLDLDTPADFAVAEARLAARAAPADAVP